MIKEILLGDQKIKYDLQRKKVKNINIRIKRDLSVHVSASRSVPMESIERILREKADFILSALAKYQRLEKQTKENAKDENTVLLFGEQMPIVTVSGKKNQAVIEEDRICLMLKDPSLSSAKEKTLQSALEGIFRSTVDEICRDIYPDFTKACPRFPTLKFRRMKSRWGSCNFKNYTLTFNYHLIHAPIECIEFVIYHEFTHFIHPNHSSAFYGELSRFVPNHKELKKELEHYKIL